MKKTTLLATIASAAVASATVASAMILLAGCAAPGMPAAQTSTTKQAATGNEYANARWFDGKAFQQGSFYVADGKLTWTRPATIVSTTNLNGSYVVPPFGEAHNHNIDNAYSFSIVNTAYLKDGIFYVKNPNNVERMVRDVRPKTGQQNTVDVIFSNGGLTSSSGHPIALYRNLLRFPAFQGMKADDLADNAYFIVETEEQLAQKWPQILAGKPDFLKTYLLHSENHERNLADARRFGFNGLSPERVTSIVKRAKAAGLRVSVHVETAADFAAAVNAGVDEINHLPGYLVREGEPIERYQIGEAVATQAAANGVTVVTTIGIAANFARRPELLKLVQDNQKRNLQLLHRAGVNIAIGSDNYMANAAAEARELVKLGAFDNATLLKLWTENTARAIFPQRKIGRLAEGYEADFLVLEGDPISDFDNVGRIRLRVKQGKPLDL